MENIPEEEKALETEAAQQKKQEEVEAAVIEEYGFDKVDDAEKIEKLTKERMTAHANLSTAIGQKVGYRTKLAEATKPKPVEPIKPVVVEPAKPIAAEDVGKLVGAELEKRDLDAMDLPEDIKKEIARVAQIQGVSIKQAARDPYIVTKVEDHKKAAEVDEAALGRTNRGGSGGGKRNWSLANPPDIDVTTAAGQKEWQEYTEWARKQ